MGEPGGISRPQGQTTGRNEKHSRDRIFRPRLACEHWRWTLVERPHSCKVADSCPFREQMLMYTLGSTSAVT